MKEKLLRLFLIGFIPATAKYIIRTNQNINEVTEAFITVLVFVIVIGSTVYFDKKRKKENKE